MEKEIEIEKNMDIIDLKQSIQMVKGGNEKVEKLTFHVNILNDIGGMQKKNITFNLIN